MCESIGGQARLEGVKAAVPKIFSVKLVRQSALRLDAGNSAPRHPIDTPRGATQTTAPAASSQAADRTATQPATRPHRTWSTEHGVVCTTCDTARAMRAPNYGTKPSIIYKGGEAVVYEVPTSSKKSTKCRVRFIVAHTTLSVYTSRLICVARASGSVCTVALIQTGDILPAQGTGYSRMRKYTTSALSYSKSSGILMLFGVAMDLFWNVQGQHHQCLYTCLRYRFKELRAGLFLPHFSDTLLTRTAFS
jgi:hypothetical protein